MPRETARSISRSGRFRFWHPLSCGFSTDLYSLPHNQTLRTQRSALSFKSSKGMVQMATNSSGGMVESWNTVKLTFCPLCTSDVKSSFQMGLVVFALVVDLAINTSSMSMLMYGSRMGCVLLGPICTKRVEKSVGRRSTASHSFSFIDPLKYTIFVARAARSSLTSS